MITAVILAAGESKRMGLSKPLLKIGDKTFVRNIVDIYKRSLVEDVIVVSQPGEGDIEKELGGTGVSIVPNPEYRKGQLSSIITGINVAEKSHADAVFIHPVDHPDINESVINKLVERYRRDMPLIVVPKYKGKRGHPVLFSNKLFEEIRTSPADVGARNVVWLHAEDTVEIETDYSGIILDIDTPEDYENLQRNM